MNKNISHPVAHGGSLQSDFPVELLAQAQKIITYLRGFHKILVAFSGGVDSTLLLSLAEEALPGRVLAVTAVSETMSQREMVEIKALVAQMGVNHRLVETQDLSQAAFIANTELRCYHCKLYRFKQLQELAHREGYDLILEGSNLDDLQQYRPGFKAIQELGIASPLLQYGLTKQMVRSLAKERKLTVWDKPSAPCLVTRLPYNTPITADRLLQIDAGEEILRAYFGEQAVFRLRVDDGEQARLEVDKNLWQQLLEDEALPELVEQIKAVGFKTVVLDLEGFRSGSFDQQFNLNEARA